MTLKLNIPLIKIHVFLAPTTLHFEFLNLNKIDIPKYLACMYLV